MKLGCHEWDMCRLCKRYGVLVEKLEIWNHWQEADIDGRIILKQIWNKLDGIAWIVYMAVNILISVAHHSSLSKAKWSLSLGFPTKPCMHFCSTPENASSPNNLIVLDWITRTIFGDRPCHVTRLGRVIWFEPRACPWVQTEFVHIEVWCWRICRQWNVDCNLKRYGSVRRNVIYIKRNQ